MITKNNSIQKNVRYRGVVLVEAALVLLMLIMLLVGMIAFGYIFFRVQHVTYLARHGARIATRYGVNNMADVTAELAPIMYPDETFDLSNCVIGSSAGAEVKVSVKVSGLDIMNVGTFLTGSPLINTYTASVTMSKEGP